MANRIQDAFDNIKAEPQLVESTKQFLSDKRRKKVGLPHRPAFPKALAAACIALFLAIGIGGYSWAQMPVSYVAIDVNPSIELALNRFDKVVSVKAYNAEGEEILKGLPLKGKRYTEAIDLIMVCKAMEAYLTEKAELVFTVAADSSRESALKSGVESCAGHSGHDSQSFSVDMEAAAKAHSYGLSLGKYHAWLQLIQYDDTVTVDECRDMSMAEIHNLINEHEHGAGSQEEESHSEEHMQEEESHNEEHMQEEESHSEEHMQEEVYEEEHMQEEVYEGGHVQEKRQEHVQEKRQEHVQEKGQDAEYRQEIGEKQKIDYQQEAEEDQDSQGMRAEDGVKNGQSGGHAQDMGQDWPENNGAESGHGHHRGGNHK